MDNPETPAPETITIDGTKVDTKDATVAPTTGTTTPAADSTVDKTTVISDDAAKAAAASEPKLKVDNKITGDLTKANNENFTKTTTTVNKDGSTTTTTTTTTPAPKAKETENSTVVEEVGKAGPAKLSGFNGGDEDDIMQKVLKKYSVNARDSTNNKTDQLLLAKDKAKRAGEIILEATHKLT